MINGDSSEEGHPVALASVMGPLVVVIVQFDDTQYQSRYLDIVPLVMELQPVLFPLAVVVPLLQEDILILYCYS
jgi:hypothetical protein